jgi:hypothetical protein
MEVPNPNPNPNANANPNPNANEQMNSEFVFNELSLQHLKEGCRCINNCSGF